MLTSIGKRLFILSKQVFQVLMLLMWSSAWLLHGLVCSSMSSTGQLTSGVDAAYLCENW